MEQGRTSLRGGHTATVFPVGAFFAQNKNSRFEKQQKDSIYIAVHTLGVELMIATGGAEISYDNLLALRFRGYLDYSPDDIFESHYDDLEDLNADIRFGYEQYLAGKADLEAQLAQEMETTKLPDALFKKVKFIAVEGWSTEKKHKSGNATLQKDIGIITEEEVDFNQRLSLYAKYTLAKRLLGEVRNDISERRLLGIALGVFLDDEKQDNKGKKISSYQSEIYKASNQMITQADVEIAAEAAEVYDLIYPERRSIYLDRLKQAAEEPVIVQLKDKEQLYPVITPEISIDVRHKRLLLGETAVKAAVERGTEPKYIHKLGELLLTNTLEYKLGKLDPYKYKEWGRDHYVAYGRWLLGLVRSQRNNLNSRIIAKASKLDLGPGIEGIANGKTFTDLPEFYEALGFKVRRHSKFGHWSFEEWVEWGGQVMAENGGKINSEIIAVRSQQNPDEPSFQMFKNAMGSVTNLLEALGTRPYHQMMDAEECISLGVSFYERYGRMPKRKDFHKNSGLPSLPALYRYCGGVIKFRELIEEAIDYSERLQIAA